MKAADDVIDVEARMVGEKPAQPTGEPAPAQELKAITMPVAFADPQAEIAKIDPALQQMRSLVAEIQSALPALDLRTKAGDEKARDLRRRCVKLRTSCDAAYKAWNAPLLEAQKGVRAVIEQVKLGVEPSESALDKLIEARDAEIEAEKQRKIAEETARIQALRAKIAAIGAAPVTAVKMPSSADIDAMIRELQDMVITDAPESFAEFSDEAEALRAAVVGQLLEMSAARRGQEDEAARLEKQRLEQLEAQRQAALRAQLEGKIAGYGKAAIGAMSKDSATIRRAMDQLRATPPLPVEFGDMQEAAQGAWQEAVDQLQALLDVRLVQEAAKAEAAAREREAQAAAERDRAAAAQEAAAQEAASKVQTAQDAASLEAGGREAATQYGPGVGVALAGLAVAVADEASAAAVGALMDSGDNEDILIDEPLPTMSQFTSLEDLQEFEAANAIDSEAESFEDIADNVVSCLQLADYPRPDCSVADVINLLLDERLTAALRVLLAKVSA